MRSSFICWIVAASCLTIEPLPAFGQGGTDRAGYRIDLLRQKASAGAVQMMLPDKAGLAGLAGLVGLGWLHVVFTAPNLNSTLERFKTAGADVRVERDGNGALLRIMLRDPEHNEIDNSDGL